jgi:pyruvate/2-oxoglutarate dehydrogenase complex dihydrolipoamide dehydrogenase (E3) component
MSDLNPLQPLTEENRILQSHVRPLDWINPTPSGRYNLVVIGGGPAGLVAAAGAAGLGARVALVERGLLGGDCLNSGCVPSKALISSARRAAAFRDGAELGVQPGDYRVSFPEVMQRMRRLRASISPHDSAQRFTDLGVDVYFGQASFVAPDLVEVAGQKLRFKKALIATGTRAAELTIPGSGSARLLTNETLFSLQTLPPRLLVIGGGPVGCEMAQSFARFGSQVTLLERNPRILPREDPAASGVVQSAMVRDGVRFLFQVSIRRVEVGPEGKTVWLDQQGESMSVIADEILVAAGRTPNIENLGLEAAGVQGDLKTGVLVNDHLRTSNPRIYAAGDVCSSKKFTHAADFMARMALRNALFGGRSRCSSLIIPRSVYTDPELAHVGLDFRELEQRKDSLAIYQQDFAQSDRAILSGEPAGFVKVYCRTGSDRILAATIVSRQAGELIGELVLAMKYKIGLKKISSVIHPYPTQAESLRKLGDQFNRQRLTPGIKKLFQTWLKWNR